MLTNPEFTQLLEFALSLTYSSKNIIPQVRIVYVSVLDLYRQMENRTGQEFPHHLGPSLHPRALTLSQLIEHCALFHHLSPQKRSEALVYFRLLATGSDAGPAHKAGHFIDYFVREHPLEHDQVRSLIQTTLDQHQRRAPAASQ